MCIKPSTARDRTYQSRCAEQDWQTGTYKGKHDYERQIATRRSIDSGEELEVERSRTKCDRPARSSVSQLPASDHAR